MTGTGDSAASADANIGVMPVREEFALDLSRLTAWMQANVAGFQGPAEVFEFKGGQSNPTYKVVTPARSYVLRRKPPGKLAKGAHAVDREAKVLSALGPTGYPVAKVHGVCTDDDVLGSWFYVMDMVEGRIFWDATFADVPADERAAYFAAMNATLAQLHQIKPDAVGLDDFGRHGGYMQRQIKHWAKSYEADTDAGRHPGMDELISLLPERLPEADETSIVHGDFRCDNMIFHPTEPRILAVLDWELSTLGHPLADFTYHSMMYRMPPDIVAGLGHVDPVSLNLPTEAEYTAMYCTNTGRDGIPDYEFYMAFNFFRIAAIFHGIKGRVIRGTAASANAEARAEAFPRLVDLALEAAHAR